MKKWICIVIGVYLSSHSLFAQSLERLWQSPPEEARPWVFWYWMQGAVSKAGITADLEAMQSIGLGGAYLMPIKGVPEKPFVEPVVEQLSPLWWKMVDFAFREADRLGLKLGFHVCDGFALAGGPWITPELSMQKVVWSQTNVQGGRPVTLTLPQPESYRDYYEDIGVFAYPALPPDEGASIETNRPRVSVSLPDTDAQFLSDPHSSETFRSDRPCWIQYAYDRPFTCRSLQIRPASRNLQSQRLALETSADGLHFTPIARLEPSRQGWQNDEYPITYSIAPVTARYFRLVYDPEGTEPGSEDLDAAKWKPSLRVRSIRLLSEARIHQYEGKNGSIWRLSARTTAEQIPDSLCIDPVQIIDLSSCMDTSGVLRWKAPAGHWTVLRMGHTSTGLTNATGGKGSGLECDKFNAEAIRLQFDSWFGKATEVAGEALASRVLKIFHVDSWECSGQNWSPVFRSEFRKRRGYDIYPYLPVMAGIPIGSAEQSEALLYDVRQTIAELITDVFYRTLLDEAHAKGCTFSAESVAPTMPGDGMLHYRNTDIPMGEFWLQSPTHDKPNDLLDAVSGAHIYGKNIVQAEAFTQLRSTFTEHPGMLKILQDRNYAAGINRLVYHVYVLNPWPDRKPGMTLDGIGLYFQRDQTWWKQAGAWVDYARRCQALLQFGRPVVDVAVFTGNELPRRALTPDRLVPFIPGIFGDARVEQETIRLANAGLPSRQMPVGVSHSANTFIADNWINPLRGYAYDSFNPDALMQAKVVDGGAIGLPSGMTYKALLVPGKHPMQPNPEVLSETLSGRLAQLEKQGASIIRQSYAGETFDSLGIERDLIVTESTPDYAPNVAYTHRREAGTDVYFISNQENRYRELSLSLRVSGRIPELWNPVNGDIRRASQWQTANGRTTLPLCLDAGESVFVVLQQPATQSPANDGNRRPERREVLTLTSPWSVQFDPQSRGPEQAVVFDTLTEWNEHLNESIRYYSGTAVYSTVFDWNREDEGQVFLELDSIYNLASVRINGKDCGTIWTKPYRLHIASALQRGPNSLEIEVSNTWANRIMGDEVFGAITDESKKTWTNARYRLAGQRLVASGLTGTIRIVMQ